MTDSSAGSPPAESANESDVVTPTEATTGTRPSKLKGVNLSGAEFNASKVAAVIHNDYVYPDNVEIDYYHGKGFTVIRLPISGARVQPVNNAALNAAELANIQETVSYCAAKGMYVILDPHDYGFKYDSVSGSMKLLGVPGGLPAAHFADFWRRLATYFKSQPNVIFGLMNEPYQQTPAQWKAVAVAAIKAIRAVGATQKILIPGTRWSGAHSWVSSGNAAAWTGFSEPRNNFAFELHQYLDSGYSGTRAECTPGVGAKALTAATNWARANRYKLFLGEIGWSKDASCTNEAWAIMNYMSRSADIWEGWTYWAAGPWYPQSYMFMLDPANFDAPVDKPQMKILQQHL